MTQEQIEAVRARLSEHFAHLGYRMPQEAIAALDHLTKANEELRAEVELAKQEGVTETLQQIDCLTGGDGEYRLSTEADRNCPDEDAMRAKIVARFTAMQTRVTELDTTISDLLYGTKVVEHDFRTQLTEARATIDRLTKEREEARKVIEDMRATAVYRRAMVAEARTRLSAMQEAIDEAVRRADANRWAFNSSVQYWTEPLRPFATKPEPEVDPLVAATQRLLQYEGHMVWCGHGNDDSKPCVCGLIDAQSKARDALAARNHTEGRTDG